MANSEDNKTSEAIHRTSRVLPKIHEDFSKIVAPITKLTRKGEKFIWIEKCADVFKELKVRLTTTPILKLPTGTGGMVIYSDASGHGL